MSKHPAATRDDHERFCRREGWERPRNATGGNVGHHITYELVLYDGRVLRTRISRPVDRSNYGRTVWSHILRDQLEVDADAFWACVKDGKLPDRGAPAPPANALPLRLVRQLINAVGLDEDVVARMSKDEAVAALSDYYSRESPDEDGVDDPHHA